MEDLSGKRFNSLTVLRFEEKRAGNLYYWRCACDCGNEAVVTRANLTSGAVKSCGCLRNAGRSVDLSGRVFGRLTVSVNHESRAKRHWWECKCECGNMLFVRGSSLTNGDTRSCGCSLYGGRHTTHGLSDSPEYNSWVNMKQRCADSKNKDYGGRGIAVCERWLNSFENFIADMKRKPGPEYSVDRKDGSGNYEPENCHWATPSQQALNRRPKASRKAA